MIPHQTTTGTFTTNLASSLPSQPPILRTAMAPQGLFAVQKPQGLTSAAVIRQLQVIFRNHAWFKPDLTAQQNALDSQSRNQRQRRRRPRQVQVKMGHGGTLDPLATGVLVIGVGTGTKSLSSLISCTKTYETTALFGASTDTYDCTGRILKRALHSHITPQLIESALDAFRGEILQKPPIYSALHHERCSSAQRMRAKGSLCPLISRRGQ
ncbi:unnamed protein product [Tuber melanosporum]|uniref:tRNA pseudouridine(55) synthase n=1 Tax=Tuber melanosporum (strain Mel28) TaxID=656061 RepID=D5GHA1_TUBMM|nr:uncharacterized protein GSTUM_00007716001 [Tuber melanosporum]CAZ83853.1 unnamed protein product [Tuber melanosporum]